MGRGVTGGVTPPVHWARAAAAIVTPRKAAIQKCLHAILSFAAARAASQRDAFGSACVSLVATQAILQLAAGKAKSPALRGSASREKGLVPGGREGSNAVRRS